MKDISKIIFCRVGWMAAYKGSMDEKPVNGGAYNKDNIGHEVHNYLGYNGKYYGFVEAGVNNSIHVERINQDKKSEYADDVTVVWVASKPESTGQYVVGWYSNAKVYRTLQNVPEDAMSIRELKTHSFYNVFSEDVVLLDVSERNYKIHGMGHSNVWYDEKDEASSKVLEYIERYSNEDKERIGKIEESLEQFEGSVKEAIVKIRVNQDKFRNALLNKYKHCCLCPIDDERLLVASHIKPWKDSDNSEKLDVNNGLLLCANHDRVFDKGLISFDSNGKIMISHSLNKINMTFMNITETMSIDITVGNHKYLEYHRNNVFIND